MLIVITAAAVVGQWPGPPPVVDPPAVEEAAAPSPVPTIALAVPFEALGPPLELAWSEPIDQRPPSASRGDRWSDPDERRPAWPPTAVASPGPAIGTYRVAAGDRVIDIATRFGISPATVVRANGLTDAETLGIGQELRILPISGRLHVVGDGDTVLQLAERYGVVPEAIVAANRLEDADLIRPGRELLIPLSAEQERAAAEADAARSAPLRPITHVVAPGDTVFDLAARYGVSAASLLWANALTDADALAIGQEVVVPPVSGVLHRVEAGDTLNELATRYEASATAMVRANGLVDPSVVRAGDLLVVPGGRPLAPTLAPPGALATAPRAEAPAPSVAVVDPVRSAGQHRLESTPPTARPTTTSEERALMRVARPASPAGPPPRVAPWQWFGVRPAGRGPLIAGAGQRR